MRKPLSQTIRGNLRVVLALAGVGLFALASTTIRLSQQVAQPRRPLDPNTHFGEMLKPVQDHLPLRATVGWLSDSPDDGTFSLVQYHLAPRRLEAQTGSETVWLLARLRRNPGPAVIALQKAGYQAVAATRNGLILFCRSESTQELP